jgi:hypothetical protein
MSETTYLQGWWYTSAESSALSRHPILVSPVKALFGYNNLKMKNMKAMLIEVSCILELYWI